jgi:hypothetical protein
MSCAVVFLPNFMYVIPLVFPLFRKLYVAQILALFRRNVSLQFSNSFLDYSLI